MINANDVENLTKAYLYSFNTALDETHNPSLAGQAVATVIMAICATPQKQQAAATVIMAICATPQKQQAAINPLEMLIHASMQGMARTKKGDKKDVSKKESEQTEKDIQKGD